MSAILLFLKLPPVNLLPMMHLWKTNFFQSKMAAGEVMTGSVFEFEAVDDAVSKIAKDVQVRKYGTFLEQYTVQLQEIENALDECTGDAWDMTLDPIALQFSPCERTTLFQLISTDNKLLNKVITVLAAICAEIEQLVSEAKTKFYNALLYYGEGEPLNGLQEGDAQIYTGRIITLLQELSSFINRCYDVVKNTLMQLSSLHHNIKSLPKVIDATDVHFLPIYEHLGSLLTVLVTLDEIIANQTTLKDHWVLYKRVLKAVRPNPSKFGVTVDRLQPFEKLLVRLEGQLLDGRIFQGCVEMAFTDGIIPVPKNACFMEEFTHCIKLCYAQIEPKIGEVGEMDQRQKLVAIFSLYVLHFYIFRTTDRKMFKTFWDVHKKVPAVHLVGNILWFPDSFLLSKLPHMAKALDKKVGSSVVTNRQAYLQNKGQNLAKDAGQFYLQVASWMIKMESAIVEKQQLGEEFNKQCTLYVQGLSLACVIRNTVTTVINLHVTYNKSMSKSSALALCRMIELLKAIEFTYHRHTMMTMEYVNHIVQHLSFIGMSTIRSAKTRLGSTKKYSERWLDALSALDLAERALNGSGTKERRLVANLALSFGSQVGIFREDEWANLQKTIGKLDVVCQLREKIRDACDCSFFYWHRIIFTIYLSDLLENPGDAQRIHYMFAALRNCVPPLMATQHESSPMTIVGVFEEELYNQMKTNLLEPLCQGIETDLRLQIHSHFQLDDRNPFRVGLKDLSPLLRIRPVCFFDKTINIKAFVERYIEKTFYNLTTVALHDWRTYGEMRNLARQKYGLMVVDDHLPSQTLEQVSMAASYPKTTDNKGLDVLEIMRNIHVFVVKYLYNLNNQIFVERSSNNKHLNTINIRHIANSIRTHGSGIMNTTVNFTYQFLRKKFYIFSQFMYDEHIKSRLIKDLRHFKEIKDQNDPKYPFDRAEKFNRGIRKLGLTMDGQSYLDQFRQLISHIGNAMGYVRMIRSGGLHCCYNAVRFIPDLEDIVTFGDLCQEEALSDECLEAAEKLDSAIGNLIKSFEGTEYFTLLIDVFAPVFRDSKNMHMRNFHIIVPPLTLNFIEHSITRKDNLNRKNKEDAAFTDDGFAMGVAFILKLLNLDREFDSLHWFQSVRDKYKREKAQLKSQDSVNGKEDEKLQQTMTLTAKRLETFQREFELLHYSLSSARIFFRTEIASSLRSEERKEDIENLKN